MIPAPIGGIFKKVGVQNQPPNTCEDCLNFWPKIGSSGKISLATRPGLALVTTPASKFQVNILADVNGVVSGKPTRSMILGIDTDLYWWNGSTWIAATGASASAMPNPGTNFQISAKAFLQEVYIQNPAGKPFVFNYTTGAVDLMVESAGTVPNGLDNLVVWQGALWGSLENVLYGSRVGNGKDWDTSVVATDTGGAFFTGGESEGLVRGEITAVIPHTTDTLLVCTVEGIAAVYGHPRKGGFIEDFSDHIAVSQHAWCKGPDNSTYILTQDGIIQIPPQAGVPPVPISEGKIPGELQFSALQTSRPLNMAYDVEHRGIFIGTGNIQTDDTWWYDLDGGGFFRMRFANGHGPIVMLENPPFDEGLLSSVVFGTENGLYRLDASTAPTTNGEVKIGPIKIAPNVMQQSMIETAYVVFSGTPSGVVGTFELIVGATAQDAINRANAEAPQFSRSLAAINSGSRFMFPRITGSSAVVRIDQTAGDVAFDEIVLGVHAAGLNRAAKYP